jgi:high-affinity Fe2+/Pb2+ permease
MAQPQLAKAQASLGEPFSDLAAQTGQLIRQEAALAKSELTDKASAAGKDIGLVAAGAFVGYAGMLAVVAGVVLLLGNVVPLWASALIVGILLAVVAYFLATSGLSHLKKANWAPEETIESIKEDAQWLKKQVD